jgi:LmbE family N-acetylglucosaminyl deacetylase
VNDYGVLGLEQAVKRLNTTASVMMIGAHPDDEDSALLAYLARGENARTAYLSITRGDGGQNIIGPELFESLGVIRTEELLQARRLDGAEQYFARAYDYGFSKTLAEAKQKWPEDVIKCDVVRAIRLFKPQVVISVWSGTPNDGHGQHQYSGYISPIAVKAAADSSQCTDAGPAWQVMKFYVEARGASDSQSVLRINTGKYDPLLGRSYFEIAMEGRSQHRSQGEGRLEIRGDQFSSLSLVESHVAKAERETSVFDGIDTKSPLKVPADPPPLSELIGLVKNSAIDAFDASELNAAIRDAAGIQIDALADRETVVPGQDVAIAVRVYLRNAPNAKVISVSWPASTDWDIKQAAAPAESNQGFNRRETADFTQNFVAKVPANAKPTVPYWLESDRSGDMFEWPKSNDQTLPFQPPILAANITVDLNGTNVTFQQPVQYRFADPARGEIRRDLNIVPALSVAMDQGLLIVPDGGKVQKRRLVMTVTNNTSAPISGTAALNINSPNQWSITSTSQAVSLKSKGEKTSVPFDITIPAGTKSGEYEIGGSVTVGEAHFSQEMRTIAYPHIQTHRFYSRAQTKVDVLDMKIAPVSVGYVMGSGDEVPEAIRQMGLTVSMIDDLATADLSNFQTIVVGIRASEVRPDFAANNNKLLDWIRNGGNLIVQYQRPAFAQQNLAPFPMTMNDTQRTAAGSTSRVVDENAKVTILDSTSPIFSSPNKITDADFNGWIQERDLYNWVTFDKQYVPLLESHDAGEQPNNGGMVMAHIGKGTYIYTSYSWFRQLPAGVPGAYRIFANLLSLPAENKK